MKHTIQKLSVLTLMLTVLFTTALPAQAELSSENKETLKEIMANNPNDLLAIMMYLYSLMYQGTSVPGTTTGTKTTETPSTTTTETPQNNAQLCTYAKGITKNLSRGMNDPQVKTLQKFLNALAVQDTNYNAVIASGDGSYGNETTYFGSGTQNAVKVLQGRLRVLQSGMVGPLTRAAMVKKVCGTSTTTGTRTPTSTGTVPQATTNSGGSDTSTTPAVTGVPASTDVSISLSKYYVDGPDDVIVLTTSGHRVGRVCTLEVPDAQKRWNPTKGEKYADVYYEITYSKQLPEDKFSLEMGIKIKQQLSLQYKCDDGSTSNKVSISYNDSGSESTAKTFKNTDGSVVVNVSKMPTSVTVPDSIEIEGSATGLDRLEVKHTYSGGTGSCDIGLGDATSGATGKEWRCYKNTSTGMKGKDVKIEFWGTPTGKTSADAVLLGDYTVKVK